MPIIIIPEKNWQRPNKKARVSVTRLTVQVYCFCGKIAKSEHNKQCHSTTTGLNNSGTEKFLAYITNAMIREKYLCLKTRYLKTILKLSRKSYIILTFRCGSRY